MVQSDRRDSDGVGAEKWGGEGGVREVRRRYREQGIIAMKGKGKSRVQKRYRNKGRR